MVPGNKERGEALGRENNPHMKLAGKGSFRRREKGKKKGSRGGERKSIPVREERERSPVNWPVGGGRGEGEKWDLSELCRTEGRKKMDLPLLLIMGGRRGKKK